MRMSQLYMPTLREVPSEAEIPSHRLLLRAGMIRKLVSGIYSYLPLGFRVLKKIENIVREEMDRSGAQELLMSAIQPKEIWEESERWQNFGPEMFRLRDRNDREFCLGPTHEEYFTVLIKDEIKSYKQLPMNLYQIQTKYRDEKRPRFGLIRCREFIMKDAYTFDRDVEGMVKAYENMWDAYSKVFNRLRLNFRVVRGDSGAMGGSVAHEFVATSEIGEGCIVYCTNCDYAATDENAKVAYDITDTAKENELEKVSTPNTTTIEELMEFFKGKDYNFVKAVMYEVNNEAVMVFIPGNRELNEVKLCNHLGIGGHELIMAEEELIESVGGKKGFTGPIGLKEGTKILIDSRVTKMKNLIVGANETDFHIKNANFGRDFNGEIVEDLLMIEKDDCCPLCKSELKMERGIEVGNIFQLGTKYSSKLNAKYLDENGKEQDFLMGSYGIGVSRSVAAVIEQNYDEQGIIWPLVVAPYHVIITVVNTKDEKQMELGEMLYKDLSDKRLEVLLDDRKERAGVKFNDRDLIGIPIRITVGKRADEEVVEYSIRGEEGKEEIKTDEIIEKIREKFDKEGLTF